VPCRFRSTYGAGCGNIRVESSSLPTSSEICACLIGAKSAHACVILYSSRRAIHRTARRGMMVTFGLRLLLSFFPTCLPTYARTKRTCRDASDRTTQYRPQIYIIPPIGHFRKRLKGSISFFFSFTETTDLWSRFGVWCRRSAVSRVRYITKKSY
jgi:hypothetical protein